MRKAAKVAIPRFTDQTMAGFSEAEQTALTALARLCSRPVALAAEIDGPPKGTEIELKAGAEFQRIKAELRTIFE